jgi:hypothetical protein
MQFPVAFVSQHAGFRVPRVRAWHVADIIGLTLAFDYRLIPWLMFHFGAGLLKRSLRRTDAIADSSSNPARCAARGCVVSPAFSIKRALRSTRHLLIARCS